ncbi:TPA: hypothetical protein ACH3X2_002539 [Trebouxia sp. C0005]
MWQQVQEQHPVQHVCMLCNGMHGLVSGASEDDYQGSGCGMNDDDSHEGMERSGAPLQPVRPRARHTGAYPVSIEDSFLNAMSPWLTAGQLQKLTMSCKAPWWYRGHACEHKCCVPNKHSIRIPDQVG